MIHSSISHQLCVLAALAVSELSALEKELAVLRGQNARLLAQPPKQLTAEQVAHAAEVKRQKQEAAAKKKEYDMMIEGMLQERIIAHESILYHAVFTSTDAFWLMYNVAKTVYMATIGQAATVLTNGNLNPADRVTLATRLRRNAKDLFSKTIRVYLEANDKKQLYKLMQGDAIKKIRQEIKQQHPQGGVVPLLLHHTLPHHFPRHEHEHVHAVPIPEVFPPVPGQLPLKTPNLDGVDAQYGVRPGQSLWPDSSAANAHRY